MQKITENVYVETDYRGSNCGFIVTKEGIVMIDTPMFPTDTIAWRNEIAKYGKVRYLINTEPHMDHFLGNQYFEGTIIANEGTREAIVTASVEKLTENVNDMAPDIAPVIISYLKGYIIHPPTITFSDRLTLYLGEHDFHLITMPGHTAFETAVYVPREKVVFTSDNVFVNIQPVMHQALPYEWLDSLKRLEKKNFEKLVPGHGSISDKSYLEVMSAVIQDWIDAVIKAIQKGMTLEEAQEKVNVPNRFSFVEEDNQRAQRMKRGNIARLYEVLKK